jgi:predicted dehydrogenase
MCLQKDAADKNRIIGTGWIASKFVADITADDPATTEIKHSIAAVASRDLSKSEGFIAQHFINTAEDAAAQNHTVPKAYGSYAQLYADKVSHPSEGTTHHRP